MTGLSMQQTDLAGKRLDAVLDMLEVLATARTLGFEVISSEIRRAEDIAPAIEAALYLACDDAAWIAGVILDIAGGAVMV